MNPSRNILIKILLYPFAVIYGFFMYLRNRFFDYRIFVGSTEFEIPIISVGNITVGGTGKTPHIEYLISLLKDEFKLATLSRGYKRKTKGFMLADKDTRYAEIGDEPKQILSKFTDIRVAVDEKRVRGVKKLLAELKDELDCILLDDAFQHRYIKPGLSILLIDFTQPMFHDHMLPLGRLRENRHEKRRANIIIVTKTPKELKPIEKRILVKNLHLFPYQNLYFTTMTFGSLTPVFNKTNNPQIHDIISAKELSVLVVTGIGRPQSLIDYVKKEFTDKIEFLRYPDHHHFSKTDFLKIKNTFDSIKNKNKLIITTEKDAVRIRETKGNELIQEFPVTFLPMKINFLDEKEAFDRQITNYVRKNKRNNQLHKKSD